MKYSEFGDQIENYLGGFTPEKMVSCFDNLLAEWQKGVANLEQALAKTPERLHANAEREYTVAAAALSQFTSARNVTEFIHLRNQYRHDQTTAATRKRLLPKLIHIAENELRNAAFCRELIHRNPMLGFHGEAFGYDYTPEKIDAKIETTQATLEEMKKALR
jgi:hypothetical protein